MTTTLFQAAKDGNAELVSSLLDEPSLDIDARDETGLTALHHAVRADHVDVVSQLLAKGANAVEVAEDPALQQNPELASVVHNALQHTQSAAFQSAPVIDSHGGKQLPDGTVSYVQPPSYQGHSVDPSMHQHQHQQHAMHQMSQPAYPFQPQLSFFDPTHNPEQRGHGHKDSASGGLPPPEVARMIPCRFFPNCRYADKCIFAHPVAMPTPASNAGPVSPGQAPMFYPSHAYGYPAYGPPQHFYSMAPPVPMQYAHAGAPMPLHMPPPHMAPPTHSSEHSDAFGNHYAAQSRQQYASNANHEGQSDPASQEAAQETASESVPAPTSESEGDKPKEAAKSTAEAAASSTTTTSFSAFMAHHAAPFQPGPGAQNGVSVGADGSIVNTSQTYPRGTKNARRGGASLGGSFGSRADFSKRSSNERPACHFFARSACKHGEECRFPHILPDGTDARGARAGRSSHSIEASRAINRALAAKHANGSINASHVNGSHAAQSSQGSNSRPAPASTNVTASTSPASAETTITPEQNAEAPASDKTALQSESAEKPVDAASTSTPATATLATKKEQGATTNAINGAASASAPKALSSDAGKVDVKIENAANGKRSSAAGKTEEGKSVSSLPGSSTNGDRVPASIPSKPVMNVNGNAAVANKQNGSKPQPNGFHSGKGPQNQNGARARNNQGPTGRANGHAGQNGASQKKPAPQRLPNADDFPALSAGQGSAAPASAPSSNVNGVTKANFSAILSAPAPVKKQPEPVKETEVAATDDKTTPASTSNGEVKESSPSTNETETKTSAPKPAAANGNSTAAPVLDFAAIVQSNPVAV